VINGYYSFLSSTSAKTSAVLVLWDEGAWSALLRATTPVIWLIRGSVVGRLL
jgi:hypothetical protein